jgi:hypothetical protein
LSEAKLWSGALGSSQNMGVLRAPNNTVKLLPFQGEPEITRSRELLEFVAGEGAKGLFVESSFITEEMERASIIQFASTNLTNRLEQISVSVRVLKRSDGTSRHRRRIPLPRNGTKGVDPLELR